MRRARGRVSRGRGIKSFYGLTFTVIIMQVLGIVLCRSSPSELVLARRQLSVEFRLAIAETHP